MSSLMCVCDVTAAIYVLQVPDVDVVLVPIGGAGLIAGVSLAVKTLRPDVQVIGVEPTNVASYAAAIEAGHPVDGYKEGMEHTKCPIK